MNTDSNTGVAVLERQQTIDIKEWFVRIGIVALFAAFFVSILLNILSRLNLIQILT